MSHKRHSLFGPVEDGNDPVRDRMRRRSTSYKNRGTGLVDLESSDFCFDFVDGESSFVNNNGSINNNNNGNNNSNGSNGSNVLFPDTPLRHGNTLMGRRLSSHGPSVHSLDPPSSSSPSRQEEEYENADVRRRAAGNDVPAERGYSSSSSSSLSHGDNVGSGTAHRSNPSVVITVHNDNDTNLQHALRPDTSSAVFTAPGKRSRPIWGRHHNHRLCRSSDCSVTSNNTRIVSKVPLVDFFRLNRSHPPVSRNVDNSNNNSSSSNNNNDRSNRMLRQNSGLSYDSKKDSETYRRALAAAGLDKLFRQRDVRSVAFLRWAVLVVWLATACVISIAFVKRYTERTEYQDFQFQYRSHAERLLASFNDAIDSKLGSINTVAASLTSFSNYASQPFPFVTLPDYEVVGSNARILGDAIVVYWLPLVTDDNRDAWEEYALRNRFQVDQAYDKETALRQTQDERFHIDESSRNVANDTRFRLPEARQPPATVSDVYYINSTKIMDNVVQDGTMYHHRIWECGEGNVAVAPNGTGPYLPIWQRSPVSGIKQFPVNIDYARHDSFSDILDHFLASDRPAGVVLNRATFPKGPVSNTFTDYIDHSQYRGRDEGYSNDPETKVAYPVFDGFGDDAKFVGVVATSLYWRLYFLNVLPESAKGILCVLKNSFGQVLAYRIDGPSVTYLGEGDPTDDDDDDDGFIFTSMMVCSDREQAAQASRKSATERFSFTTLPLDTEFGTYQLQVYPTRDTYDVIRTNDPILYTTLVATIFLLAAFVFVFYDCSVQKRQRITMGKAIENADKAAVAERELNEYIAHEVRNPLSAALSACNFVKAAVDEPVPLTTEQSRRSVRDDLGIISSSLGFINELLRTLLDLNRATDRQIRIRQKPIHILNDILKPVASMLYRHDNGFQLIVESTPRDLTVETDCLRLKQILLNLGRDAAKFTTSGFLRLRADVIDLSVVGDNGRYVRIYVEDSGPGIPIHNRKNLFSKFQESLEVVHQGCGMGLCLSKNLLELMGGHIWLDEHYESGVPDNPGTRFILDLNTPPMENGSSDLQNSELWSEIIGDRQAVDQSLLLASGCSDRNVDCKMSVGSSTNFNDTEDLSNSNASINDPRHSISDSDTGSVANECQSEQITAQIVEDSTLVLKRQHAATAAAASTRPAMLDGATGTAKPQCGTRTAAGTAAADSSNALSSARAAVECQGNTADIGDKQSLPGAVSVLFVDDDKILRKLFSRSIKRVAPSWTIEEAPDGETAIEMVEESSAKFDLIFMDQYMSSSEKKLLGTETVEKLRTNGVAASICGLSANDVKEQFLEAGADSFMLKPMPVNKAKLKEELLTLLQPSCGECDDATTEEA